MNPWLPISDLCVIESGLPGPLILVGGRLPMPIQETVSNVACLQPSYSKTWSAVLSVMITSPGSDIIIMLVKSQCSPKTWALPPNIPNMTTSLPSNIITLQPEHLVLAKIAWKHLLGVGFPFRKSLPKKGGSPAPNLGLGTLSSIWTAICEYERYIMAICPPWIELVIPWA